MVPILGHLQVLYLCVQCSWVRKTHCGGMQQQRIKVALWVMDLCIIAMHLTFAGNNLPLMVTWTQTWMESFFNPGNRIFIRSECICFLFGIVVCFFLPWCRSLKFGYLGSKQICMPYVVSRGQNSLQTFSRCAFYKCQMSTGTVYENNERSSNLL